MITNYLRTLQFYTLADEFGVTYDANRLGPVHDEDS
jgi:hypothetical protein